MKLRKFFGPTSRAVLEQVRAELGPDAMIVANHASAEGIEISALPADALPQLLVDPVSAAAPPRAPAPAPVMADDDGVTVSLSTTRGRDAAGRAPATAPSAPRAPDAAERPQPAIRHAIPGLQGITAEPATPAAAEAPLATEATTATPRALVHAIDP